MKRLLVVAMLCAMLLAGCAEKEDSEQANAPAPEASAPAGGEPTLPTKLGDAAYPLAGLTWVKGDPVTLSPGNVYVVEFWATWCPPCRASIPHLTALQKKYQDRVTFIGVSQETVETVEPFVTAQAEQMDYTVAVDPTKKVSRGYMTAFGQGGIPHAFVVDGAGKVVWHGHPMDPIEPVLDQVLAGAYAVSG